MAKALSVVNQFYDLTNDKGRSTGEIIGQMRPLVADNIAFIGPLRETHGASEYLALNERLLPAHVETRMLKQFADGDQVCSIYELVLRPPAGGTLTIPMADLIRVVDGRIAEQRIYYDPRRFATAFGM